jgi:hypothetical protein
MAPVASASGSVTGPGRRRAAVVTTIRRRVPRKTRANHFGARIQERVQLDDRLRAGLQGAASCHRSRRTHSTVPSADLAVIVACPLSTARAAASASTGSDLPRWRRSWRLGRLTSTTATSASRSERARPAPREPVPSTRQRPPHRGAAATPAAVRGRARPRQSSATRGNAPACRYARESAEAAGGRY